MANKLPCDLTKKNDLVANSKVEASLFIAAKLIETAPNSGLFNLMGFVNHNLQFEDGTTNKIVFKTANVAVPPADTEIGVVLCPSLPYKDINLNNVVFTFSSSNIAVPKLIGLESSNPSFPLFISNFKLYPNVIYDKKIIDSENQNFYDGDPLGTTV